MSDVQYYEADNIVVLVPCCILNISDQKDYLQLLHCLALLYMFKSLEDCLFSIHFNIYIYIYMSTNEENYAVINRIYYDMAGYGSVVTTYNDAKLEDPSITKAYVQGWFVGNAINRKQPNGKQSFVAPGPGYEYQVDLF